MSDEREKLRASDDSHGDQSVTRCPICEAEVDPDHPNAPFCSGRCRLVDLGNWMKGDYVISREIKDADLDEAD